MLRSLINSFQKLGLRNDVRSWYVLLFSILTFQVFFPPQFLVFFLVPMLFLGVFYMFNNDRQSFLLTGIKDLIPLLILFLLYFITMFLSNDSVLGGFKLEKKILLFFMPFIACVSSIKFEKKEQRLVFLLYCISMLLFFAVVHTQLFLLLQKMLLNGKINNYWSFFSMDDFEYNYRVWLGGLWHIHPTYLGVLINMSILIGVYFISDKHNSTIEKIIGGMSIIVGLVFLGLVASRMAYLSLILAVSFYLFSTLKKHKVKLFFGGVLIVLISLFALAKTNARVKEIVDTKLELPTKENFNSVNIRIGIYSCTFDLLKDNWLLGVTPGDLQKELNTCYESKNMPFISERNYNTHNEFLNQWLSFGLIGLLLLLFVFAMSFYKAINTESFLFIGFLVICLLACLSENLFERYHGTMFFSFFYSFFMFMVDGPKSEKG